MSSSRVRASFAITHTNTNIHTATNPSTGTNTNIHIHTATNPTTTTTK